MCCSDLHLRTKAHPPRGVSSVGGRWPTAELLPRDYLSIITQDYNNLRLMAGHCWGYKALAVLLNSGHVCRATPTPELPVGLLGPLCYCLKVQLPPLPSLLPSSLYSGVPQRLLHPRFTSKFLSQNISTHSLPPSSGPESCACQMAVTI